MKYVLLMFSYFGLGIIFQVDQALIPKESQEYKFVVNNKNYKNFGYRIGADDVPISAADILIVDSVCYVLDPVHYNLKIINLKTGTLTCSQSIRKTSDEIFLMNLVEFNNFIYILSVNGTIYKYEKSGKLINTISIGNYFGTKYIYEIRKDHLTIFQDADFEQDKNERVKLNVKRIDLKDSISTDAIVLSGLREYSELRERIRTKKYSFMTLKGQSVLKTDSVNYILGKAIPKTQYVSSNLDFIKDKVVFFDINPKQLTLYFYRY